MGKLDVANRTTFTDATGLTWEEVQYDADLSNGGENLPDFLQNKPTEYWPVHDGTWWRLSDERGWIDIYCVQNRRNEIWMECVHHENDWRHTREGLPLGRQTRAARQFAKRLGSERDENVPPWVQWNAARKV